MQGHTGDVNSAAFSPDGKRIFTVSFDDTARVWDADTVSSVAFSPDGTRTVRASDDKTARVWSLR